MDQLLQLINPDQLKYAHVARNLTLQKSLSFVPLSLQDSSQRMVTSACLRSLSLRVRLADRQEFMPAGCTAVWLGPKATTWSTGKKTTSLEAHLVRLDFRWDEVFRSQHRGALDLVASLRSVLLSGPPAIVVDVQPSARSDPHPSQEPPAVEDPLAGDVDNEDDDDADVVSAVPGDLEPAAAGVHDAVPDDEEPGQDVNDGDDDDEDEEDEIEIQVSGLDLVKRPQLHGEALDNVAGRDVDMTNEDFNEESDGLGTMASVGSPADPGAPPHVFKGMPNGTLPANPPFQPSCAARAAARAASSAGSSAGGVSSSARTTAAPASRPSHTIAQQATGSSAGSPARTTAVGRVATAGAAHHFSNDGLPSVATPEATACGARRSVAAKGCAAAGRSTADEAAAGIKPRGKKKTFSAATAPQKQKTKRAKLKEEMKERMAAEAAQAAEKVVSVNTYTLPPRPPYVVELVEPNCVWRNGGVFVTVVFPFLTDHTWRLRGKLRVRLYVACAEDDGADFVEKDGAAPNNDGDDEAETEPEQAENTYKVKAWLQPKSTKDITDEDRITVPQETATSASVAISDCFLRATGSGAAGLDDEQLKTRIIKTVPPISWRFDTSFTSALNLNSSAQCIDPTASGFSVGWTVVEDVDSMDVAVNM